MVKRRISPQVFKKRKKKTARIVRELKKLFPNPKIALKYGSNWELLVAVILSAQCTDKKVNEVTTTLFKKYKTLEDYVEVSPAKFEQDIKSTGFYRAKTRGDEGDRVPGEVVEISNGGFGVAAKGGTLLIGRVQPEGSRKLSAAEWMESEGLQSGARFGT